MYRRRYFRPAVWHEMERMQQDMNQLASTIGNGIQRPSGFPAMNVWASDNQAVITAEVPGMAADDLDLSVVGETLTISGERKPDHVEDGIVYHRRERGCGKFSRSIELPFRVDTDRVEAAFANGILSIDLPRAEADKPKRINIATA